MIYSCNSYPKAPFTVKQIGWFSQSYKLQVISEELGSVWSMNFTSNALFFCTEITYLLGSGQIATSIASLSQLFMGCTFSPSLGISAQKCGHRGSEIDILVKVYKWKPSVAVTNKMTFRSQSRKIPPSAGLGLCGEQYWFPYWHDFMPLLRHTTPNPRSEATRKGPLWYAHSSVPPTSTSQEWQPEVKPEDPRTLVAERNVLAFSGGLVWTYPYPRLCRSLREYEEVLGCGKFKRHIHEESQHLAVHAHHRHHHIVSATSFPRAMLVWILWIQRVSRHWWQVLILPLQIPEAGETIVFAECQTQILEMV